MTPLPASFYETDTISLARQLLGCILVSQIEGSTTSGIINETEAYLADDPASHSFKGQTPRNTAMFGPPGSAYVYRIYGLHWCVNVTSNQAGIGEAVLIRGLIPLEGIETMINRRSTSQHLCDGPAKLCQALGITGNLNHHPLNQTPLFITKKESPAEPDSLIIHTTPRIGITKAVDAPLRFLLG